MIDLVPGPRLPQDLDHLSRSSVAVGAVGGLAGEIRRGDIEREAALQHVVQRRHGAREHDRLHLAAAHRRQKVDPRGERRAGRDEGQRVLAHLVGGRAQHVAKAQRLGRRHDLGAMREARPQAAVGDAEMPIIV